MYSGAMMNIESQVKSLTDLVINNRTNIQNLMESSKIRFALFDMKRRNFGGTHPLMRPEMDGFWTTAMQQDSNVCFIYPRPCHPT